MEAKKILVLFLISLILFGILIRFLSINEDFTGEEIDFIKSAEAIKDTGHPIIKYHSEQYQNLLALWHPPMYIYSLAFIFKFISQTVTEPAARSLNIIFSLLTAILIYLFCVFLIKEKKGKIIGLLSSAFFLLNYYTLSSSILIDIDILSTFFTFAFFFFLLLEYKTKKKYFFVLSIVSLFFSIFNRYIIALIIYFFIGVYYFFNPELKKDFKKYLLIGFFSFLSFLLVWTIYSVFVEPGTFFSFFSHNFSLGTEQISSPVVYFGSFILNISQFIRLVTFPAVILIIWSFISLFRSKSKLIKFLLIYSLSILLFFFALPRPAFGYNRYFLSAFPAIAILVSIFLYFSFKDVEFDKKKKIILILSFLSSLFLLLIFRPQPTFYSSKGLILATNLLDFLLNIFSSLPLFFVALFRRDRKRVFLLVLVAILLSYSLYFDLSLVTHNSHIKEAATYLKENTSEKDIIMCPKAIGHYTGRRFYSNDNNKPQLDFSSSSLKEYFKRSLINRKMDDEFFWPKGFFSGLYPPIPSEEELNQVKYVVLYHKVEDKSPEIKIGDFYIYNLK